MRLEFSPDVENDLDVIVEYIAAGNTRRAVSLVKEIRAAILLLRHTAYLHQLRPDIAEDARTATVGRYVILFFVKSEDVVRVERVVHGSRDGKNLLSSA